jgi:hypothetical protein
MPIGRKIDAAIKSRIGVAWFGGAFFLVAPELIYALQAATGTSRILAESIPRNSWKLRIMQLHLWFEWVSR